MTKIALCAESFGYGPVSKAAALGKVLKKRYPQLEFNIYANSIAQEFFLREGFPAEKAFDSLSLNENTKKKIIEENDAAIIALDPRWTSLFVDKMPTFFMDSLGFMWNEAFFNEHSDIRKVTQYFIQNAFKALNNLEKFNIKSLHPVGAMTFLPFYSIKDSSKKWDFIVQLGGLINIFSKGFEKDYAQYIGKLLSKIVNPSSQKGLLLTSNLILNNNQLFEGIPSASLDNYQAVCAYAGANYIFTSPGLTTLIELAFLKAVTVPLPPQNFSQCVIIHKMVQTYSSLPEIWYFLHKKFYIEDNVKEEVGCKIARERLESIFIDPRFMDEYQSLALDCIKSGGVIPYDIVDSYNGLSECAKGIGLKLNL